MEKKVNGPNVHGKAAIVAMKPSPIIARKDPVFPRVLMLCFVKVGNLKTEPAVVPKEILDRYDTNDEEEDANHGLSQI